MGTKNIQGELRVNDKTVASEEYVDEKTLELSETVSTDLSILIQALAESMPKVVRIY